MSVLEKTVFAKFYTMFFDILFDRRLCYKKRVILKIFDSAARITSAIKYVTSLSYCLLFRQNILYSNNIAVKSSVSSDVV